MCNNDAPVIDECPCCENHHNGKQPAFPFPRELRDTWWIRFKRMVGK